MNLMLKVIPILLLAISPSKSVTNACINDRNNESDSSVLSRKVFEDINISTAEDLIYHIVQLDIIVHPTSDFANSVGLIAISSEQEYCNHTSEYNFNMNETSITIPKSDYIGETLEPGCNYTIMFSVEEYCIYRYYKIPEHKPCQHYSPEFVFDTYPNKIIENVNITSYMKNAIRLNILFSPTPEFADRSGHVVIHSKMNKCNHPEEFSFSLAETNLTLPTAEFPHTFIDSGCKYMIDFEVGRYCVTTTYEVPDFCSGNEPIVEILKATEVDPGIYMVTWKPKLTQRNKNYSIIDITYRLDDVLYHEFNGQMVLENNFLLNYSKLNLSRVPKGINYKLTGVFVSDNECSSISSIEFAVTANPHLILQLLVMVAVFFGLISTICAKIPSVRAKIVLSFKYIFGVAIKTPEPQIPMYTSINRKEEINPNYQWLEMENGDEFEFPRHRLKLEPNPASGNFGLVYTARALGINKTKGFTTVAVKTLRDNAPKEEVDALVEEINTLKKITSNGSHENVVKMLGCCTIQKPDMLILELVACGDLKNYLMDLRNEWSQRSKRSRFTFSGDGSDGLYISPPNRTLSESSSNCLPSPTDTDSTILFDDTDESLLGSYTSSTTEKKTPALSNIELQSFALQISKGMAFLESISVVHRDLAARNVLINEMKILKISDFGMSRIGDYVHKNTGQQPLRWMAPESIEQFVCTSKSDVWSFGVVLWEIGTLGAFPYDSTPNDCILEYLLYSLKKGIRLMRPEICTDELYSLMLKCWSENPDDRPTFQQIVEHLSGEKKKIYMDFKKLNPAYVFPPAKQS